MNIKHVGEGNVCLIAGGDKVYTDIAARFVRSERSLKDIIASDYDAKIVENILKGGHLAATEFDYFIFGIEGYARVTEIQLVRKRIASYLIKSGRVDKHGKRSFDVVLPEGIEDFESTINIDSSKVFIAFDGPYDCKYEPISSLPKAMPIIKIKLGACDILGIIEDWYNTGVDIGLPEEDLRYMKPQATEFKAIIGMNAHSLLDWFKIRTCLNAQKEINHLARKMMSLCKDASQDLFKNAGPNCVTLGYCPENQYQNKSCVDKVVTKDQAMKILADYKKTTGGAPDINPTENKAMWK